MRRSAAHGATRSAPGRRSGSSPSATTSASGTRGASARELWNLYNGRVRRGEHVRVFPISNWTELDVWEYILSEGLEVPPLYTAHEREVFARDGMLYAVSDFIERMDGEAAVRGVGALPDRGRHELHRCGALRATTLEDVAAEIAATRVTERGETRADDRVSEAAMEDRKREGYFSVERPLAGRGGRRRAAATGPQLLRFATAGPSTTASRR